MILVGDSVAMVVLGYDDTLSVTVEDMAHHTAAVARARPVGAGRGRPAVDELPREHAEDTVRNAASSDPCRCPVREARGRPQAGADDRGARRRRDPGDGPPGPDAAVHARHGWVPGPGQGVRGRPGSWWPMPRRCSTPAASRIVLEGVPDEVAGMVTDAVDMPTIGIGAGRRCDGQVLVFHDLLGHRGPHGAQVRAPLRRTQGTMRSRRCRAFAADVRTGAFPGPEETYHLDLGAGRGPLALRRRRPAGPARSGPGAGRHSAPTCHTAAAMMPVGPRRCRLAGDPTLRRDLAGRPPSTVGRPIQAPVLQIAGP